MLLVRGRDELSAEALLGCFDFDGAPNATVAGYLREVIACVLDEEQRWALLRWCTSWSGLPASGLGKEISLLHKDTPDGAPADQWLPVAHTCALEVELPAYSSRAALEQQLAVALQQMAMGGGFGEE